MLSVDRQLSFASIDSVTKIGTILAANEDDSILQRCRAQFIQSVQLIQLVKKIMVGASENLRFSLARTGKRAWQEMKTSSYQVQDQPLGLSLSVK